MLTLDNMAERYSLLPSEVLARADTLDLEIIDISAKFSHYSQTDKYKENKGHTEKSLLKMLKRVEDGKQKD